MARESITSSVNTGVAKRRAATTYGRRLHERQALSEYGGQDGIRVMETTFTYDKLPSFVLGDELYNYLPKGVKVLSAGLYIVKTFVGGTALTIGTYGVDDGLVVDVDGLVDATDGAVASLAAGNFIVGTGDQLNTVAGLAENMYVKGVATGTFTAGEATLTIEYQLPTDRYAELNG